MQDLMIVFVVLLVLLTLISTLGGSIYPKEYFTNDHLREKFWQEEEANQNSDYVWEVDNSTPPAVPTMEEEQNNGSPPEPEVQIESFQIESFQEEPEEIIEGFEGDMYASIGY
jgi:hypothetical protein